MQNRSISNLFGVEANSTSGTVNWALVATNVPIVSFARIRCTEGISTVDASFITNVAGAQANAILCGGFHIGRPVSIATYDPEFQANSFIANLQLGFGVGQYGDLYPVAEFNDIGGLANTTDFMTWCKRFRFHFESSTGRKLGIFITTAFVIAHNNFFYPTPGNQLLDMPLIVSDITNPVPSDCGGWTTWLIWRYSVTEAVLGFSGGVTVDVGPYNTDSLKEVLNPTQFDNTLYITDDSLNLIAIISNTSSSCPYIDAIHEEQINKVNTLEFTIPSDNYTSTFAVAGNLVYFRDYDEYNQIILFEIIRVEETHTDVPMKMIYCENKAFELLDIFNPSQTLTNYTMANALTAVVGIGRWTTGIVQPTGTRTFSYGQDNRYNSVLNLLTVWGSGELRFRVLILGKSVQTQLIDILNQRGSNIGKRFEYTRDMASIKRTIDYSNTITLCYGYGATGINISGETWTNPPNPANKPYGSYWINDVDAKALYGRYGGTQDREGVFNDSEILTASELITATWDYLQAHNMPFISYEMNAVDFEFLFGYPSDKVRLGDTVGVIDRELATPIIIEARVVEIRRCLDMPEKTIFVIGNIVPILGGFSV